MPRIQFIPNYYLRQEVYISQRLSDLSNPSALLQSALLEEMLRTQDSVNLATNIFNSHLKTQLHLKVTLTVKSDLEKVNLLLPLLLVNFLAVFVREFRQLHRKRRQVTGYILLLPGRLIKENQFLKVWLSRALGIKQSFDQ